MPALYWMEGGHAVVMSGGVPPSGAVAITAEQESDLRAALARGDTVVPVGAGWQIVPRPEPTEAERRAAWRPTASRSFARLVPPLVARGWITAEEARAWLRGDELPALAVSLLAGMPDMQALEAEALLWRMQQADRLDPITLALAEAKRQTMTPMPTPEEMAELVDELFGWRA